MSVRISLSHWCEPGLNDIKAGAPLSKLSLSKGCCNGDLGACLVYINSGII